MKFRNYPQNYLFMQAAKRPKLFFYLLLTFILGFLAGKYLW